MVARRRRLDIAAASIGLVLLCSAAMLTIVTWVVRDADDPTVRAGLVGLMALAIPGLAFTARRTVRELTADVRTLSRAITTPTTTERVRPVGTNDALGALVEALDGVCAEAATCAQTAALDAATSAETAALTDHAALLDAIRDELAGPLQTILDDADALLAAPEALAPEQRRDLEIVREAGAHLTRLFDDVLDLSAASSNQLSLQLQDVDVTELLTQVAGELRGARGEREVAIVVDVPDALGTLRADPTRLRQVLSNLGDNALKFTEGAEIRLVARSHEDVVELRCEDDGPGIAPDALSRLFDEFEQLEPSDGPPPARPGRGAGLGLAIARRLVALHGGTLDAQSQVGAGTSFVVRLPRTPARSERT